MAEFLTLPIATAGIADVRAALLPIFAGVGLLLFALSTIGKRKVAGPGPSSTSRLPDGVSWDARRWLWWTAWAVLAISMASAMANDSIDLSWGWILRFAAGAGWALLLCRAFSAKQVRDIVVGLVIVGLFALALSIAHRSDRQLAYFSWPIGPITSTAAMAALWAAVAGGWATVAIIRRRFSAVDILSVVVFLAAIYVLQQTGRRAPTLGLLAAALWIAAVLFWSRLRTRRARLTVSTIFLFALVVAVWIVAVRLRAADESAAGALALRFEYWRIAARLILDGHLSLGHGPDTFVVAMTNAVAPLRAVSPHFYHGNINLYAHNEWIQAALELGIPGALFYFALPMGILLFTWRHLQAVGTGIGGRRKTGDESNFPATVAISAGLVAIVVTECAGITLRTAIMPLWFWTLLGLLATRENRAVPQATAVERGSWKVARFLGLVIAAVSFLVGAYFDLSNARVRTDDATRPSRTGTLRLYADQTIASRRREAIIAGSAVHPKPDPVAAEEAVHRWRELHELIPGYLDTPARFADALLLAGQNKEADWVLRGALQPLTESNRYEPSANALHAGLAKDRPTEQLRCVQRALRHAALSDELLRISIESASAPVVGAIFREELPMARESARNLALPDAEDGSAELLRINALSAFRSGRFDEALGDQRLAANYYAHLERSRNPYRRGHDAETDAFFALAKMLDDADRANYAEACDAIAAAERYAVLGISHQRLADPKPEYGFVIGEVVPTDFPPRLYSLWRFSSLLHLAAGKDRFLDFRIYFGLPTAEWNEPALRRELSRLAERVYEDLTRIPADRRPAHYDELPEMARRYSTPDTSRQ